MKEKVITLRLDSKTYQIIKEVTDTLGMTLSEYITALICGDFERKKHTYYLSISASNHKCADIRFHSRFQMDIAGVKARPAHRIC